MKGLKGLFLGILTVVFLFPAAPLAAQAVKIGVGGSAEASEEFQGVSESQLVRQKEV
ncbi:MAG: hypothetical protein MZV70_45745 [Desulfobacterales bacterium]|nr:hypothetical protein [Desulfobacterales bacterium]